MSSSPDERTFIFVKSNGVQRSLIGVIINRFENRGLKLIAAKLVLPTKAHYEEHYFEKKNQFYFDELVQSMLTGPVFAMIWEGTGAIQIGRKMIGNKYPDNSNPGAIRTDFSLEVKRSIIHASDSIESAEREISLWFKPYEITNYKRL